MNRRILTKEQIERIVELGCIIWSNLSDNEQENYYNTNGTIGFVEDVLAILHLYGTDFPSIEVFEQTHNRIIYGE